MHGGGTGKLTEFMDVVTDSLQNEKSLKIFKYFVVQGQLGLVDFSSRIRTFLEDSNADFSCMYELKSR